jgi:hypothetical protein
MSTDTTVPTQEIVLESGHKVKIRTSLKARAYTDLKNYIVRKATLEAKVDGYDKQGSPQTSMSPQISGEDIVGLEAETMKTYIVSFDDDEKNAYDRMMDAISGSEYEEVKTAVDSAFEAESKK